MGIFSFMDVGHWPNCLDTFVELAVIKTSDLPLKFRSYPTWFKGYKHFRGCGNIAISGHRSLSQSPRHTFFELDPTLKSRICRRNFGSDCSSSRDRNISGFGCHTLPFPVSITVYHSPAKSFFKLAVLESQIWRWNFGSICNSSKDISISGFGGQIDFRLSASVTFIWGDFFWACCGGQLYFYRQSPELL